ncbi:MAG: DUF3108 domain-containing protein [Hyphomicrobiaceae bacterium]
MLIALSPRSSRLRFAAISALATFGLIGPVSTIEAGKQSWPSHVAATYDISFNGFGLGQLVFKANVGSGRYELSGDAEISALFGFVNWRGVTQTSGKLGGTRTNPSSYSFDFRSSEKAGSVRMGFGNGQIVSVSANPEPPRSPEFVPVERSHLKGVLDPLTAVMAMTRPESSAPCQQRLKIFDGIQRFDLVMAPAGTEQLKAKNGTINVLQVCEMRYFPISGYDRNGETPDLARNLRIRISLRQVPEAGLFIPQEIKIPTALGSVVLELEKAEIQAANRDQVAFAD